MIDRLKANCGGDLRLTMGGDPSLKGGLSASPTSWLDGMGRRPVVCPYANPANLGHNH